MIEELSTPRGTFEHLDEVQLVDCREQYGGMPVVSRARSTCP